MWREIFENMSGNFPGGNFLGGNFPWVGQFDWWKFFEWEFS